MVNRTAQRAYDIFGVILFFAMVPCLPLTIFAMYLIMDRLGLIGL